MIFCSAVLCAPNLRDGSHYHRLQSFADCGDEDSSPMRRAAMFEKENALPRSELHFSVHNWHGLAGVRQDHADV